MSAEKPRVWNRIILYISIPNDINALPLLFAELDAEGGKIVLDEKDGGLAAGQFVAFYDEDAVCVGSAVIAEASVM